jgi:site-specific DNA-methyltransferase (cytosine-N4-specific)
MKDLLRNGYQAKRRPSGHDISRKFQRDNEGAIPPNLIALPNTESNSYYLRYCRDKGYQPHPARFPARLPEYFIRMLTDVEDTVFDPFAGSCVTGEVCERLQRRWLCCDNEMEYLLGALGRFTPEGLHAAIASTDKSAAYEIGNPARRWNGVEPGEEPLPSDGGRRRSSSVLKESNESVAPQAPVSQDSEE